MNKIYRVIWNVAQQAWVVVSELVKGHVKSSSNQNNNDIVNEIKTSPKSTALFPPFSLSFLSKTKCNATSRIAFCLFSFYSAQLILKPNSRAGGEFAFRIGAAGELNHGFAVIGGA
mgnify:CR=1 FL=1